MLHIPQVLTAEDVAHIRQMLVRATGAPLGRQRRSAKSTPGVIVNWPGPR